MDFEHSERARAYIDQVERFAASASSRNEKTYVDQLAHTDDWRRWRIPPILEELKAERRASACGTCSCPTPSTGPASTNRDYAPIAEVTGKSFPRARGLQLQRARHRQRRGPGEVRLARAEGSLAEAAARRHHPLGFAMTEPAVASSDATNMKASCEVVGDEIVLNGRSGGPVARAIRAARFLIFMGVTDPNADRHQRHSMVLGPASTRRASRSCACRPCSAHLDETARARRDPVRRGPSAARPLHRRPGRGFRGRAGTPRPRPHPPLHARDRRRRARARAGRAGAVHRVAFGKTSLASLGGNRDVIANCRMAIDQARLLTLKAAWALDRHGVFAALTDISAIKVIAPQRPADGHRRRDPDPRRRGRRRPRAHPSDGHGARAASRRRSDEVHRGMVAPLSCRSTVIEFRRAAFPCVGTRRVARLRGRGRRRGAAVAAASAVMTRAPRIGLVLGGGGVIGNAYLSGVLEGIRRVSGWGPGGRSHHHVGTSAGSVNGAFTAIGVPTELTYRYVTGERPPRTSTRRGGAPARASRRRSGPSGSAPTGVLPRPFLPSPHCMLKAVLHPWDTSLEVFVAGLLGEGMICRRRPSAVLIAGRAAEGWPERVLAVAVDLESGARVALDATTAAHRRLARGARFVPIPAFFAPVQHRRPLRRRRHLSVRTSTRRRPRPRTVVCVNPMSSPRGARTRPVDRITAAIHEGASAARGSASGAGSAGSDRLVEESGTQVPLVQPTAADLEVIPVNLMRASERRAETQRSLETTTSRTGRHAQTGSPRCAQAAGSCERAADPIAARDRRPRGRGGAGRLRTRHEPWRPSAMSPQALLHQEPLSGEDLGFWWGDQPKKRTTMAMLLLLDRRPHTDRLRRGRRARSGGAMAPAKASSTRARPREAALGDDPTFDLDFHVRRYALARADDVRACDDPGSLHAIGPIAGPSTDASAGS